MQHLTVWPRITPQGDLAAITDDAHVAASARDLTNWLADIRREQPIQKLGLTSVGGGTADAPVAALAVARTLALSGKRVILIDLARMGSFVGGLCGVPQGPGLSDLVTGAAPFTKIIARDARSPVHVLRFGTDHSNPTAGLIHERIQGVLDALSQTYDSIIVNLGEAAEDTPVYLHRCDAALIMAPAAEYPEAAQAVQTLLATGVRAAKPVLIGEPDKAPAAADTQPQLVVNG
jgi:Mrp family chromosome partitioning ATPase